MLANGFISTLGARFNRVQEIGHIGVWYLDIATGLAEWSDETLTIYGLPITQRSFTYEDWLAFIHPEDVALVENKIQCANEDGTIEFVARIVRADGGIRYVHQVTVPEYDIRGVHCGMFGTVYDITDTIYTNDALQNSLSDLQQYKIAIEESSIVSITDRHGKITYANEGFCRISKYSESELLGRNHNIVNSGYHGSAFWSEMWKVVSAGKIWKGIVCNKAKDGSFYWVKTTIVPFFDEGGKPLKYISIRTDITELYELRLDLTKKNSTLEKLVSDIQEANERETNLARLKDIIFESSDEKLLVNELYTSINKLIPLRFLAISHNRQVPSMQEWLIASEPIHAPSDEIKARLETQFDAFNFKSEAPVCATYYTTKDETGMQLLLALRRAGGDMLGCWILAAQPEAEFTALIIKLLTGVVPLLTSKLVEFIANRTIAEVNVNLQREVEMRTRDLMALNHNLELFASTVSHDLKTPLRHISAYVGLLQAEIGTPLSQDALSYFDFISSTAKRMSSLIDALLMFSRLDQHELQLEEVDMCKVVERILEDQKRALPDKIIVANVNITAPVWVDRLLFTQVFENLISNAVKYSARNEEVKISILQHTDETSSVFSIKDNGVGFDGRFANKLFKPFQRLHTLTEFDGNGVGLASAARIISRHHGSITASSEPGNGALFIVTIPTNPKK